MRVAPVLFTAVCITNLGGLEKSAAHFIHGDVIHQYHFFSGACITILDYFVSLHRRF